MNFLKTIERPSKDISNLLEPVHRVAPCNRPYYCDACFHDIYVRYERHPQLPIIHRELSEVWPKKPGA